MRLSTRDEGSALCIGLRHWTWHVNIVEYLLRLLSLPQVEYVLEIHGHSLYIISSFERISVIVCDRAHLHADLLIR